MIRNLKALGLAFAAMLALGAVAASAASAQQGHLDFRDKDGNTVDSARLIATENVAGLNALTAFGISVECPGSFYTGHEVDTTPHEPVPDGATEITLTPHYNNPACEDSAGREATVEMNSCDYDLEIGDTTPSPPADTYALTATITCDEPGDEIHVGIWAEGNEAHESSRLCTIEVGEQYLTGADIRDNTNGTLTATGTLGGIAVERHGLCVLDGKGTSTTGQFHLDANVTGEDEEENAVKVGITD